MKNEGVVLDVVYMRTWFHSYTLTSTWVRIGADAKQEVRGECGALTWVEHQLDLGWKEVVFPSPSPFTCEFTVGFLRNLPHCIAG